MDVGAYRMYTVHMNSTYMHSNIPAHVLCKLGIVVENHMGKVDTCGLYNSLQYYD